MAGILVGPIKKHVFTAFARLQIIEKLTGSKLRKLKVCTVYIFSLKTQLNFMLSINKKETIVEIIYFFIQRVSQCSNDYSYYSMSCFDFVYLKLSFLHS